MGRMHPDPVLDIQTIYLILFRFKLFCIGIIAQCIRFGADIVLFGAEVEIAMQLDGAGSLGDVAVAISVWL